MSSLNELKEYLNSEEFKNEYRIYLTKNEEKNDQLINFINNIKLNKKYYRLGIQKNKKYRAIQTSDTNTIKEINSLINKITNQNYETIKGEIIQKINIEHIKPFIYEKLLESSLMHHIYIKYYVGIIKDIHMKNKLENILKLCEKYYIDLFETENYSEKDNEYESMCKMNKKIDNIIGFSLLISYLEKENIIDGFIEKVIDSYMNNLMDKNEIELYKLLVSFENISSIHYRIIPDKYRKILLSIQKNTKSSKIRFKVMDILDM